MQLHSGLISNNLQDLAQQLSSHQQMLASLVAHPLPQFPNNQTHLLEHILRTKPEPEVKEWLKNGQEMAQKQSVHQSNAMSKADLHSLWKWAPIAANDEVRKQTWGGDYTMAEKVYGIENIKTGLIRELQEPPDPDEQEEDGLIEGSDEDEDDQGELSTTPRKKGVSGTSFKPPIVQQASAHVPIEDVFRFTSGGSALSRRLP